MLNLVHTITECPEGEKVVPISSRWQRRTIDPAGPFLVGTWTELWVLIKVRLRADFPAKVANTTGYPLFQTGSGFRFGICHIGGNPAYGAPHEPGKTCKHAFGQTTAYHENNQAIFEVGTADGLDLTYPAGNDAMRHNLMAPTWNEKWLNGTLSATGGWGRSIITKSAARKSLIYRFTRPNNNSVITNNQRLDEDTSPIGVATVETPIVTLAEWFRDNNTWANLVANRPANWSVQTSTSAGPSCNEPVDGIFDTVYFCGGSDGWIPEFSLIAMKTPA